MSKKDTRIFIRADSELVERMERAAEIAFEGNVSLFAREAFKEKIEKLARRHPELREAEAA
jgi:hypothetical protein